MAKLRLTMTAVLVLPILGVPAVAQDSATQSSLDIAADPALKLDKRGFSLPIVEYDEPTGARQQRKGIIAGQEIAPGTIVGLGLFETAPRVRGYVPEMDPSARPKRSRQAAVGLSWRF